MIPLNLGNHEDEIRVFASALRNVFRDETWDFVEPHARRAWAHIELGDPWEAVVDRIRESWSMKSAA
jgi:hypothetical protein